MALVLALTDDHGADLPAAYGVIDDWNLQGHSQVALITLSWYATQAAYQKGFPPFKVDKLTLGADEQQSGIGQLIAVLYAIVQARPDYVQSKLV